MPVSAFNTRKTASTLLHSNSFYYFFSNTVLIYHAFLSYVHGRTNLHSHTNRYGTFGTRIQTAHQRTVPTPLQKTRTVQEYRTT